MGLYSALLNGLIRFILFVKRNLQQWREAAPIFIVEEIYEYKDSIKIRIRNIGSTITIKTVLSKTKYLDFLGIDDDFETTRYSVKHNLVSPVKFPQEKNYYFRFNVGNIKNKNSIKFEIEYWDSRNIKDSQYVLPYKVSNLITPD